MSVYDGESWLAEAIDSVLNQTFTDYEFLIVNDGSTDGSGAIINRYAEQDSRIRVFDKPNTGLADSLNYGIARAKGKWIARIDADDLCAPERLEKQYTLAESNPSIVLIGTGLQQIDENGKLGKIYLAPNNHDQLLRRLTSLRPFFAHSSAFYSTEVVKSVGGYRPRIRRGQDWDLWLRLSEVGRMDCVSLPFVYVRSHDKQISHDEGGKSPIIYSRVALVSYWLRRSGFDDPVGENNSEKNFIIFRNWVVECLERDLVFEHFSFLEGIKKNIGEAKGIFSKLRALISAFLSRPSFFFRYLWRLILGERSTRRLSKMWMSVS